MITFSLNTLTILSLLGGLGTVTSSSTIPCPGVDDASNFSAVPLSERPHLARILQHGFQPSLINVTLPNQWEQPPVSTYQGFVDRPFRTLLLDNDQCRYTTSEAIRCVRSTMASFGSGPGGFAEKQFFLEMGSSYDITTDLVTDTMVDAASYATWADTVETFFGTNRTQCSSYSSSWIVGRTHSCSVAVSDCQIIDPEFKADLASLPVEGSNNVSDAVDLTRYQAFVDKWGHGTVDRFAFGFVDWQVSLQPINNDAQEMQTLYMGRAGGTGNYTGGDYYTEEECGDPAPINLRFRPWDRILTDLLRWEDDSTILNLDLDAIQSNFRALRQSYPYLFQQVREQGLANLNCPPMPTESPATTDSPTNMPSDYSTQVSSTENTSSPTPSLRPSTFAPTLMATNATSNASRVRMAHVLLALVVGVAHSVLY